MSTVYQINPGHFHCISKIPIVLSVTVVTTPTTQAKSANQPNEIALTICNPISRYCFRLMRDWKLENLLNGKEISVVPFRMEKDEYLWRYSTISERNFRKITLPYLISNRNFRIFWPNGKHPGSSNSAPGSSNFVNHLNEHRPNWTPLSPLTITNTARKGSMI